MSKHFIKQDVTVWTGKARGRAGGASREGVRGKANAGVGRCMTRAIRKKEFACRSMTATRKTVTHLTYSTTMLYAELLLDGTTAAELARTFRLGLNGTVQDKQMGKKTAGDKIGCFLHTRAAVRDKQMGKAIL